MPFKYSAINSNFEDIASFQFDEIKLFEKGVANVRIGDKWGALNSLGKIIVPVEYTYIGYCKDGIITVGLGDYESNWFVGHYGLFDKSGKKITKIIYEYLGSFKNGYVIFKKNSNYGLINRSGTEIINNIYDDLQEVANNIYLAEKEGLKYYIHSSGREFRQR